MAVVVLFAIDRQRRAVGGIAVRDFARDGVGQFADFVTVGDFLVFRRDGDGALVNREVGSFERVVIAFRVGQRVAGLDDGVVMFTSLEVAGVGRRDVVVVVVEGDFERVDLQEAFDLVLTGEIRILVAVGHGLVDGFDRQLQRIDLRFSGVIEGDVIVPSIVSDCDELAICRDCAVEDVAVRVAQDVRRVEGVGEIRVECADIVAVDNAVNDEVAVAFSVGGAVIVLVFSFEADGDVLGGNIQ